LEALGERILGFKERDEGDHVMVPWKEVESADQRPFERLGTTMGGRTVLESSPKLRGGEDDQNAAWRGGVQGVLFPKNQIAQAVQPDNCIAHVGASCRSEA
jgi:hypothetical protein